MWILVISYLLLAGQDQCPQDIDCDRTDTAAIMKGIKTKADFSESLILKLEISF
jgi:hypothetical protein